VEFGIHTPLITVFLNTSYPKHPEVNIWVLKFHKTRQWGMVRENFNQSKAAFEAVRKRRRRKKGGGRKMCSEKPRQIISEKK